MMIFSSSTATMVNRLVYLVFLTALILNNTSCRNGQPQQPALPNPQTTHATESSDSPSLYKGPLIVKIGGKYGYIDRTGKIIINPQFDEANNFSGGLAEVCLGKCPFFADQTNPDDSKYGYINEKGQF